MLDWTSQKPINWGGGIFLFLHVGERALPAIIRNFLKLKFLKRCKFGNFKHYYGSRHHNSCNFSYDMQQHASSVVPWCEKLLIERFLFDPAARIIPNDVLAAFIVHENEDRERKGGEPPTQFERIHSQSLIHTGRVREEHGQASFEYEAKIQNPVIHALLEDRVLSSFANYEIRPLDHDNGPEKGCVTSILENLPVFVRPLLMVRILKVVNGLGIPFAAQTKD